ncbi:MAG: thioredoxin-disulfide reductase [Candidatus Micrarchaeota archaeon]|nr:thioredoxin-disulfide reductase [Candidatus Micrarchaeota archaeon]
MEAENLIIIGSGPAGYTAALYASRESLGPLMISGFSKGGQLMLTTMVDNYPGFPDGILGPELMEQMRKQAEKFGTRFIDDNVSSVDLSKRPFEVKVGEKSHFAKALIISTGASSNWMGLDSEQRLIGHGVSSCATCDAFFYKGKNVIVVGGGDSAMEEAQFLTKFANSVTIVHRRDSFRASKIMQDKTLSNPKIKVVWNSAIEEVLGKDKVEGVRLNDLKTGQKTEMKIDGVFVAIGHSPNTKFLNGQLKLDQKGYIVTEEEVKTDVEGVFAAGDVVDHIYRQAVTAAGSGAKAAIEARSYLYQITLV